MGRMKSAAFYIEVKAKIEKLLRVEPELSGYTLAKRFGIAPSTAKGLAREIREKITEEINNVDHL